MGREIGTILESRIPELLVKLGKTVQESRMNFMQWLQNSPDEIETVAADFIS